MRKKAIEAAEKLIHSEFPACMLAVLGGSVIKAEANPYSDLDIVILDDETDFPFRKTLKAYGWIIELFILNSNSYREIFDAGIYEANPTLQRILTEGIVIKADAEGKGILEEAREDLSYGPMPWNTHEIDHARYEITEHIEDLKGSVRRGETWFIANKLSVLLCKFVLRVNCRWVGEGKHLFRILTSFAPNIGEQLECALDELYRNNNLTPLMNLSLEIIEPYGGPLLEGFEEF